MEDCAHRSRKLTAVDVRIQSMTSAASVDENGNRWNAYLIVNHVDVTFTRWKAPDHKHQRNVLAFRKGTHGAYGEYATDELDVVGGRVEAIVVAQAPAGQIDAAKHQHIELVEMEGTEWRKPADAGRDVEPADQELA